MEERIERKGINLKKIIPVFLAAVIVLIISLPVIRTLSSPVSVIIKDREMNYFRGRNIYICGAKMIVKRSSETAKSKKSLPDEENSEYYFTVIPMENIVSIEIADEDEEGDGKINPRYLGRYKIHLQGHEGVLVLNASKERVYGSVRFPNWGKGAVERLKGVRISGKRLSFTRSASTGEEVKRLGANYLFKQNFSGRYSSSGSVVKGFMLNDRGEKHEWEAERK